MAIPISSSLTQLNAEVFFEEGFELSLDAIVPSVELTGSFSTFQSRTQLFIYDYSKRLLYDDLDFNGNGSYLPPENTLITSIPTSSIYNQFELNPVEDIYNQGYSSGKYYISYNFVDYELGSELIDVSPSPIDEELNFEDNSSFSGHPYFIKEISGDRTEIRIQNNFLTPQQVESYYNEFENKLNNRENVDEFYISFEGNRNFIGVNSLLVKPSSEDSLDPTSILIKLYTPLPASFEVEEQLQIITKVGETQVFEVEFNPNLEFIDNLLSLKGPNYNIDLKDRVNNSTNFKTFKDLVNTNSSQSYYQFNSLQNQKGVILRKNWAEWKQFVKYSSAEQRLNNFKDKLSLIEAFEDELLDLNSIALGTTGSAGYSSSYNAVSNNINEVVSNFDSYEYFLYYITGSESWPKSASVSYPYPNYSVSSSEALNWFGSTNETSIYYNTGKNQILSASLYDENNQDYLYYLIPPFINENNDNNQYIKFVNMTGQAFDEMYLYTEAVEQVRNTNSSLTGSVLPLGLADEVIESLGFETYGNNFNSVGFNVNSVGAFPVTGSGLEYITHYIDIASGSVINYYDKEQSTLGYVIALADPSFPYPLDNSAQEIYKRIFHNMVSLVKRKGTVTGLRQLINIWGVPSTMLRISEFGGKNKDDENDYDLWMNRYSTAFKTYEASSLKPSGSVRIPWQPLTNNYYDSPNQNYYSVPDNIQFRFKMDEKVTPTSNFSQSLLVKGNLYNSTADFGVVLSYSGSQSGSFLGSQLPTDNQYGTLKLVMSASAADGGIVSASISLPFFNNDWWSVQVQRKTNVSQSLFNGVINEYELKTANNIYDGYDGNQVGFQGLATITMADNKTSSSINEAWNDTHNVTGFNPSGNNSMRGYSAVVLGGMMYPGNAINTKIGTGASAVSLGSGFSGSFQEFRYYRRALSGSQFNDYVMNPESIQGHADSNTGLGSSYDLLSFRLPLGNELEYTNVSGSGTSINFPNPTSDVYTGFSFGGNSFFAGQNALGSLHPSLVNKQGSLYTSSFIDTNNVTSSQYNLVFKLTTNDAITASYLAPNTEINYMDQPAAGIRNRIKNKIQVIDNNEYGTILSPFRSIQQEFEQSSSYTEDLNSLEVGFSFQNEINDDIISTYGHGVVSDAIADPRFISESSDRYPELTRIAEDYFKKYQGVTIFDPTYNGGKPTIIEKEYDYNRLIKFYESSLFRAIKNYIPARTSLSTGIIVKQHLLERNKTNAVIGINNNSLMAKTPETGSNAWGYTTETGFNSGIFQKNLLVTSSINMYSLTGSAGGSINKYNIITNEGQYYQSENSNVPSAPPNTFVNLFPDLNPSSGQTEDNIFLNEDSNGEIYLESAVAFRSQMRFNPYLAVAPASPGVNFTIQITSSERGGIFTNTFPTQTNVNPPSLLSENYVDVYPNERLYVYIACDVLDTGGNNIVIDGFSFEIGEGNNFDKPEPKVSQQVNWYIDDFTGEYKVKDTQEEFYNGEYSGSNVPTIPAQYNPYRIFADGNDKTPDAITPDPFIDFTQGGATQAGVTYTVISPTKIRVQTVGSTTGNGSITYSGSFFNLIPGVTYKVSASLTFNGDTGAGQFILGNTAISSGTVFFQGFSSTNTAQINAEFVATNNGVGDTLFQPYTTGPGAGFDNGGIGNVLQSSLDIDNTIEIYSLTTINTLGPKHLQPNDGFTIVPSSSFLFQNSNYNPLLHNVSGSRKNSYLFDQDFDPVLPGSNLKEGIPNDYALTISSSQLGWNRANPTADNLLEYSEVPDSNYTTEAIINPRYKGSKITSADYNFRISEFNLSESAAPNTIISPLRRPNLRKQSKIEFLNGETGSWEGDSTNEYPSAIDTRPIYFAHFKSSYENMEIFNSTTFNIDQLIQVPFDSIQDQQTPIITSSQLTGNNQNLIAVGSTFTPNRKTKAIYNQSTKQFRGLQFAQSPSEINTISPILNYENLPSDSSYVLFPAQDIISDFSNQKDNTNVILTQSFFAPQWITTPVGSNLSTNPTQSSGYVLSPNTMWVFSGSYTFGGNQSTAVGNGIVQPLTSSVLPYPMSGEVGQTGGSKAASTSLFITGSSPAGKKNGYGLLYIQGYACQVPELYSWVGSNIQQFYAMDGPHLQMMNNINHNINNGDVAYSSSTQEWDNGEASSAARKYNVYPQYSSQDGFDAWPFVASNFINGGVVGSGGSFNGPIPSLPLKGSRLNPFNRGEENYFRFDYSSSALSEYNSKIQNAVMIEEGDEIRVTYAIPLQSDGTTPLPMQAANNNPQKQIVNQTFTVLGYELAPQQTVFSKGYDGPGGATDGWGTTSQGETFFSNIEYLPPEGIFSPDNLKERLDLVAENSQSLMAYNTTTVTQYASMWTGSVVSCEVTSRAGEPDFNNPSVIAVTGSLKVKLKTDQNGSGGSNPLNNPSFVIAGFSQACMRGTMGGITKDGWNTLAAMHNSSQFQTARGGAFAAGFDAGFMYDTLKVTPDPSELAIPILSGSIMSATIRKRVDNDTKIVLDLSQPDGAKGILTPSGDGYLVPDDLTDTQRDNVQKIINVLKSQNSFTNPPDANESNNVG